MGNADYKSFIGNICNRYEVNHALYFLMNFYGAKHTCLSISALTCPFVKAILQDNYSYIEYGVRALRRPSFFLGEEEGGERSE